MLGIGISRVVFHFVWKQPYMAYGKFLEKIIEKCSLYEILLFYVKFVRIYPLMSSLDNDVLFYTFEGAVS